MSVEGLAEDAKARAPQWALMASKLKGWNHIIMEGDYNNIVEAVNSIKQRNFHTQVTVDDCILCSKSFRSCFFCFCDRECNSVPHNLARRAVGSCRNELLDL